jgi:hypothetical protein
MKTILFLLILTVSSVATGDTVKKWTDEKGNVHYGDKKAAKYVEGTETLRILINNPMTKACNVIKKQRNSLIARKKNALKKKKNNGKWKKKNPLKLLPGQLEERHLSQLELALCRKTFVVQTMASVKGQ